MGAAWKVKPYVPVSRVSLPIGTVITNMDMILSWAKLDVFAYIKLFEGTPQCTVTEDFGLLQLK